jgi:Tol biopolymer transport system component
MLDERFRSLKATRTPDLWPDIEHREPRPPRPEIPWGRFGTAAVAFAVAAAGIAFAARAFLGEPPRMQSEPTEPAVGNGLITFSDGGDAYVVEENGSGLRNLTRTPQGETLSPWEWSPDGTELALYGYVDDPSLGGANYDIYVMDAEGRSKTNLTTTEDDVAQAASQTSPTWSPDGRWIAYTSDEGAEENEGSSNLHVVAADGSEGRRITQSPLYDFSPDWSPDGSKIVFHRVVKGSSDILTVSPDGSSATRLTSDSGYNQLAVWSPDGTRIAFTSSRVGANEVFVMDADGSAETQLTDIGAKNLSSPTWSPDGTQLAFEVFDEGDWDIWIVNADGSAARPLTHGPGDETSPEWAPDGSSIAFLASPIPSGERDNTGTFDVYVMNADGTDQERLTRDVGALGGGLAWQAIPTTAETATDDEATARPSPSVVRTIDVGQATAVEEGFGSVWVTVLDGEVERLLRLDPETGETVARLTLPVPTWEVGGAGLEVGAGAVWVAGSRPTVEGPKATVIRIDPETNQMSRVFSIEGAVATDLVVYEGALWAPVAGDGKARLVGFDLGSDQIIPVPLSTPYPREVFVSGGAIWVHEHEQAEGAIGNSVLTKYDPVTDQVVASIPFDDWVSVASSDDAIWASRGGSLARIDPATARFVGDPIPSPGVFFGGVMQVGHDGIWFMGQSDSGGAAISWLNTSTGEVEASVDLGERASPIALEVALDTVWVLTDEGALIQIDPT